MGIPSELTIYWQTTSTLNWAVFRDGCRKYLPLCLGIVGFYYLRKIYMKRMSSLRRQKWMSIKSNVIFHRRPQSASTASSATIFSLKVETYLRIAGIQYEIDYEEPVSQTGQTPWISLSGVELRDSPFSLSLLAETFGIDLNSALSLDEKVKAKTIQIVAEEHLQPLWQLWQSSFSKRKSISFYLHQNILPYFDEMFPRIIKLIEYESYQQRISQQAGKNFIEIGVKEIRFFSRLLGSKPYFMGEKPTELDCIVFAILSHIVWHLSESPFEWKFQSEFLNLTNYCERIKFRL